MLIFLHDELYTSMRANENKQKLRINRNADRVKQLQSCRDKIVTHASR